MNHPAPTPLACVQIGMRMREIGLHPAKLLYDFEFNWRFYRDHACLIVRDNPAPGQERIGFLREPPEMIKFNGELIHPYQLNDPKTDP